MHEKSGNPEHNSVRPPIFQAHTNARTVICRILLLQLKLLAIAMKCSVLDVAGVLSPPHYEPIWTAYTNNLNQVPEER